MPQVRKSGTAWERRLDDYAYTKGLDGPGWAWEFLRRNDKFLCDCRLSRPGRPAEIVHVSESIYVRPKRRFLQAETWGLLLFPNPRKAAIDTPVFWHPDMLSNQATVMLSAHNDNDDETISLDDFSCQRMVLLNDGVEHVVVRNVQESIGLQAHGRSILTGQCKYQFQIDRLARLEKFTETLRTLTKLRDQTTTIISHQSQFELHLRDYLVALDGHLAGRSYRDIAEVIYGSDRVKNVWTNETRFLKETVRRAVRRGIQYMESDYRTLL